MRKNIPAYFFAIACLVNWAGRIWDIPRMSSAVKPALLPLLAMAVLVYDISRRLDKRKLAQAGFTPLPDWKDAVKRYLREAML